jgi:hypothetical protein
VSLFPFLDYADAFHVAVDRGAEEMRVIKAAISNPVCHHCLWPSNPKFDDLFTPVLAHGHLLLRYRRRWCD